MYIYLRMVEYKTKAAYIIPLGLHFTYKHALNLIMDTWWRRWILYFRCECFIYVIITMTWPQHLRCIFIRLNRPQLCPCKFNYCWSGSRLDFNRYMNYQLILRCPVVLLINYFSSLGHLSRFHYICIHKCRIEVDPCLRAAIFSSFKPFKIDLDGKPVHWWRKNIEGSIQIHRH